MSWLPNPFKSLRITDDEKSLSGTAVVSGGGSVKEDLSEFGETIGRQLRGVAAFLAPPPRPSSPPTVVHAAEDIHSPKLAGIRNDLVEIGGSFKSSLSILSSQKAAAGISMMNCSLPRRKEKKKEAEEEDRGVGITNEVVDFVTDISEWPECWTDFPLPLNDDGFNMTRTQAEHISAIEQIVPSLTDLKTTLKSDMDERKFWMIYFILLIPRLNENSVSLLSTPEVTEARKILLTKMRSKRNSLTRASQPDSKFSQSGEKSEETSGENIVLLEKSVVCRGVQNSIQGSGEKILEVEDAQGGLQKEDNISFSDLDGDDTDFSVRQYGTGRGQDAGSCSSDGSSDWVRLNKHAESKGRRARKGQLSMTNRDSEGEESSDWLTIHEFDYYN